tara:strand:- start:1039 stop:2181 length:1143 start_codon:yes stop_codon:yes gene_type:complete
LLRVLIPIEFAKGETRVSASPETVKKFLSRGCCVSIEKGAGRTSGYLDEAYESLGAQLVDQDNQQAWNAADLVLCVQAPNHDSIKRMKADSLLIGLLSPYGNQTLAEILKESKISAISLELLPRISRAQSADALSSQANIAGYKSVLIAAGELDRYFPMLMTAAGTVQPAKTVVLGAGVAGLQAVATAKRLGSVVFVSDIRPAVKEQVESLGARFIDPPEVIEGESEEGGYAKEASQSFLLKQRQILSDNLADADVAICTAQVPGKKAPNLIDECMLDRMRPGSVVIDLAVEQGGNCSGSVVGQTVLRNGVKIIGASDLPASVPNHASSLYSRNIYALLEPFLKEGSLILDHDDPLIDGSLISLKGEIRLSKVFNPGGSN